MTSISVARPAPRFIHTAFFYRNHREYTSTIMRFIMNGIAAGDPVMVAVPPDNLARLRMALGSEAHKIEMYDMTIEGRNPGRIIGDVLMEFARKHSGRHTWIVGEPMWADRDSIEYPACIQHEWLINAAFEDVDSTVLCPYSTSELSPRALDDAKRTHPVLWTDTEHWVSDAYESTAEPFNVPLSAIPMSAMVTSIYPTDPGDSRRFTASFALAVGLPVVRIADAVLAVDELVSNTVTHGGGYGQLAAWTEKMRAVFEVSDAGYITDPLAGRRPVEPTDLTGRGLALVHRQSDLVRIYTSPSGTAVRVYFNLC